METSYTENISALKPACIAQQDPKSTLPDRHDEHRDFL